MLLWNIHFKILVKTEFYDDEVPGRLYKVFWFQNISCKILVQTEFYHPDLERL
jgi:hypothetical protein